MIVIHLSMAQYTHSGMGGGRSQHRLTLTEAHISPVRADWTCTPVQRASIAIYSSTAELDEGVPHGTSDECKCLAIDNRLDDMFVSVVLRRLSPDVFSFVWKPLPL
jgi:hypothetical protein